MRRKEYFYTLVLAVAVLILVNFVYLNVGVIQSSTISRHPYIQMGTSNSVVIVWRTSKAIQPRVYFSEKLGSTGKEVSNKEIDVHLAPNLRSLNGDQKSYLFSAPNNTHQYEAQIRNLKSDTLYYYSVYNGNRVIAGGDSKHFFRTYPITNARPLRFWVVGDSGKNNKAQKDIFKGLQRYLKKNNISLDAYLHVGDMAYWHGRDSEFQSKFFAIYKDLLSQVVCWPTIGNHDSYTGKTGNRPYNDAFVLPTKAEAGGVLSGTEYYYSYEIGPVHFISLNSLNIHPTEKMTLWLKNDLKKNKKAWTIVYFHHPPYTKGTHDSDTEAPNIKMREHIMPILEPGGVDLVLGGHSHIYERSMLIDGAYATPTTSAGVILDDGDGDIEGDGAYVKRAGIHEGTIMIVVGNGGAGLGQRGISPVMKKTLQIYGSIVIEIHQDTLKTVMIDQKGKIQDRFHIIKKDKTHFGD